MMQVLKRNVLLLAGAALGAVAGYFYYTEVGCTSGTCPITSDPMNSTAYGAFMGGIFGSMFKKENTK